MTTCKRCRYEWVGKVTKPKRCPYCQSYRWNDLSVRVRPVVAPTGSTPLLTGFKRPIPYSQLLDKDRDIFKLTRTPKALVEAAIAQIREVYEPDVAEEIIQTAMEKIGRAHV